MIHLQHIEQYRREFPDAIPELLMGSVRDKAAETNGIIGVGDLGTLLGDHQTAGTIAHLVATGSDWVCLQPEVPELVE